MKGRQPSDYLDFAGEMNGTKSVKATEAVLTDPNRKQQRSNLASQYVTRFES